MLPRKHPDRIQIAFDDHRLVANAGLLLPATLAQHLGLPQLVDRHVDLGRAPGRANTGDKLMTLVASAPRFRGGRLWPAATVSTTPMRCAPGGRPAPWAARSRRRPPPAFARAGSGRLPAQLPVGPCPPVGPGEPGVAGPGLGGWGRTRRRTFHHRPRFDHLRDLRPGQGGRPPPRLHRPAGLSPAAGRRRRYRRRADGPAARGPGQHRSGRWPLPAGDGGTGAHAGASGPLTMRADSGFYTHGVVSACRKPKVRFSITIRQRQSLRDLIEAIPKDAWTPIPY